MTTPITAPIATIPDDFSYLAAAQSAHTNISEAIAAIPAGRSGALLVDATGTTAEAMIATHLGNDNWTLAAGGTWDGHHVAGKVTLVGAWGKG